MYLAVTLFDSKDSQFHINHRDSTTAQIQPRIYRLKQPSKIDISNKSIGFCPSYLEHFKDNLFYAHLYLKFHTTGMYICIADS